MRRHAFVAVVIALAWTAVAATTAWALPITKLNKVQGVSAVSNDQFLEIDVKLDQKQDIGSIKPSFGAGQIEFQLDKSYVAPSKKTYRKLEAAELNRILVYQNSQNSVAFKVVHDKSFQPSADRVTVDVENDKVRVRFWKVEPTSERKLAAQVLAAQASPPVIAERPTPPTVEPEDAKPPIDLDKIFADSKPSEGAAATADAAPAADKAPDSRIETGSGIPNLSTSAVKMAASLLAVLGAIGLLAFAARRYLKGIPVLQGAGGGGKIVRVIASAPLGLKKQVSLVEVAGQLLVLGVSESNVTLLARVDDAGGPQSGEARSPRGTATVPGTPSADAAVTDFPADAPFARELRRYEDAAKPDVTDSDQEREDALKAIRDRLANMKRLS